MRPLRLALVTLALASTALLSHTPPAECNQGCARVCLVGTRCAYPCVCVPDSFNPKWGRCVG